MRSWPCTNCGPSDPFVPWSDLARDHQSETELGTSREQTQTFCSKPTFGAEQSHYCAGKPTIQSQSGRDLYFSCNENRGERTRARRKLQIGSLSSQKRGTLRWHRTMETACQDSISNLCITFPLFPPVRFYLRAFSDWNVFVNWWRLELFREMKSFFNLSWGSPKSVW